MIYPTFATLVVILLASVSSAHDFAVCKNQKDLLGVNSVSFQPDPPQSGNDLSVNIKGVSQVDIVPGSVIHLEVRVYGVIMDSQKFDACAEGMLVCPLAAGSYFDLTVTQPVPAGIPPRMAATVRMRLESSAGVVQSCLEAQVEVGPTPTKPLLGGVRSVEVIYQAWKQMFPKAVHNFEVFAINWERIVMHNTDKQQTYRMEMNEFGCLTPDEFAATHMGIRGLDKTKELSRDHIAPIYLRSEVYLADPPKEIDWVTLGKVTPVKNQGSCGSCWAFSTIASIESAYAIKTGKLTEFSEQELVSCDTVDSACQGGLMDNAFNWLETNMAGGLCTEDAYPYMSGNTGARGECLKTTCEAVEGSVPSSYLDIQPNEAALQVAVATHGPVSVAIEADQAAFQFYKSGVLTGKCGAHLDHGVLLVGYGVDDSTGLKYWKIKNSWGATWGEEGYVRIVRGKRWPLGGECGISAAASFPVFD